MKLPNVQNKIIEQKEAGNNDQREVKAKSDHQMISQLRNVLKDQISNDMIRMTTDVTEIRLRVNEQVFFAPGSSQLNPSGRGIISDITKVLEGKAVQVIVEGHSDADGSEELLNWKLSTERAVAVIGTMRGVTDKDDKPLVSEVFKVMDDMVDHGLHILTIGQYLQPTKMHLEVDDFISPDIFEMYKEEGLNRGLKYVESGPLVRSSYHAERQVNVPI